MNALARQAGCDKVLIYRYFGDLDGVYSAYAAKSDFWWRPKTSPRGSTRRDAVGAGAEDDASPPRRRVAFAADHLGRAGRRTSEPHAPGGRARGVRERRALQASAWIDERYRLPSGLDFAAISMLLGVAIKYLAVRARTISVMSGVRIASDADWKRVFAAVDADRRHACGRRLIFFAELSPIGDEQMEIAMTPFVSNRRDILRAGGATLFLALRRESCAPPTRRPPVPEGDAYAPWTLWNDPSIRGTPLALVAAGVIAANPHDTQPWLFARRRRRDRDLRRHVPQSRRDGRISSASCISGWAARSRTCWTPPAPTAIDVAHRNSAGALLDSTEPAGRCSPRGCG